MIMGCHGDSGDSLNVGRRNKKQRALLVSTPWHPNGSGLD